MTEKLQIELSQGSLVAAEWSHRHDLCVMLRASGMTNNEIAAELGYDPAYVSRILADPRGIARLAEFRAKMIEGIEDAGEKLQALASEAVTRAAEWMRSDNPMASVRSAFGILDRAGYSKVEKHMHAHVTVSEERMDRMLALTEHANTAVEEYDYSEVVVEETSIDGNGDSPGQDRGEEESELDS